MCRRPLLRLTYVTVLSLIVRSTAVQTPFSDICQCPSGCVFSELTHLPVDEADLPSQSFEPYCTQSDGSVSHCFTLEDTPFKFSLAVSDHLQTMLNEEQDVYATYELACVPTMGTVTFDPDNPRVVTYRPSEDRASTPAEGKDVFTYRVQSYSKDPLGTGPSTLLDEEMQLVEVYIEPVDDRPRVTTEGFVYERGSTQATYDAGEGLEAVLGASDPDGDALTYSIVSPPANGFACTANTATDHSSLLGSEHARAVCLGYPWDQQVPGQVLYVPAPGFRGDDAFQYRADSRPQTLPDFLSQPNATYQAQCASVAVQVGVFSGTPVVVDATHLTEEDQAVVLPLVRAPSSPVQYEVWFEVEAECGGAGFCTRGQVELLCQGREVLDWRSCASEASEATAQVSERKAYFRYAPDPHRHGRDYFKFRLWYDDQGRATPGENEARVTIVINPKADAPVVAGGALSAAMSPAAADVEYMSPNSSLAQPPPLAVELYAEDMDDYEALLAGGEPSRLQLAVARDLLPGSHLSQDADAGANLLEEGPEPWRTNVTGGSNLTLYYRPPPGRRGALLDTIRYLAVDAAGLVSAEANVTIAVKCAPGYQVDPLDEQRCLPCQPGRMSVYEDAPLCVACQPGMFNPFLAASSCALCGSHSYQDERQAVECKACPLRSSSAGSGHRTALTECRCEAGAYGPPGTACIPCPNHLVSTANLRGMDAAWTSCSIPGLLYPLPRAGYWIDTTQLDPEPLAPLRIPGIPQEAVAREVKVRKCAVKAACLAAEVAFLPDGAVNTTALQLTMLNISQGHTCAVGYKGEACSECCRASDDHPSCVDSYYRLTGRCEKCPETTVGFYIGAGLMICLFLPVLFRVAASMQNVPAFNIALGYAQIVAFMPKFDLNWPQPIVDAINAISALSFNLELVHPECSIENWGWAYRWAILMLLPVALAVLLLLGAVVATLHSWTSQALSRWVRAHAPGLLTPPPGPEAFFLGRRLQQLRHFVVTTLTRSTTRNDLVVFLRLEIRVMLTFLHLGYVFLSWNAVEMMDCKADEAAEGEERYYMEADPSVECWNFDGSSLWARMFPVGVLAILAYPVGIFLGLGLLLYAARGRTQEPAAQSILGFLYARYLPSWYWFELVVMARKSIVVCTPMLFSSDNYQSTMRQTIMAMGVLLASLLYQFHAQPYDNRLLDQMECVSVASQFMMLFAGLIFLTDDDDVNEGSSVLSATFRAFLSVFIVVMLVFSYLFFSIHVLLDIFPDAKSTIDAFRTKMHERRRNRKEKKERKTAQSLVSTLKASQFADIMRLSLAVHRNLTATGKRLALAYREKHGQAQHMEVMRVLKAFEEAKKEKLSIWLRRKDVMPMHEVLQAHMALGILEGMSQRTREENDQALAFVQRVMGMQAGASMPQGFVPSRQSSWSHAQPLPPGKAGGGSSEAPPQLLEVEAAAGPALPSPERLLSPEQRFAVSLKRAEGDELPLGLPDGEDGRGFSGPLGRSQERLAAAGPSTDGSERTGDGNVLAPNNTPFSSMAIPMDVIQMVQMHAIEEGSVADERGGGGVAASAASSRGHSRSLQRTSSMSLDASTRPSSSSSSSDPYNLSAFAPQHSRGSSGAASQQPSRASTGHLSHPHPAPSLDTSQPPTLMWQQKNKPPPTPEGYYAHERAADRVAQGEGGDEARYPTVSVNKLGTRAPDVEMQSRLPTGSLFPPVFPADFGRRPLTPPHASAADPRFSRPQGLSDVDLARTDTRDTVETMVID